MAMVPIDKQCVQIIGRGRKCSIKAVHGYRCHKHKDQSYYARVSYRVGLSKARIDEVASALFDEMTWDQIHAFNRESRRGQLYDDAGGYLARCIAKLFGARGRYDSLDSYKAGLRVMDKESNNAQ